MKTNHVNAHSNTTDHTTGHPNHVTIKHWEAYPTQPGCVAILKDSPLALWVLKNATNDNDVPLQTDHVGPWQAIKAVRGLAITKRFGEIGKPLPVTEDFTLFFGVRSLSNPTQDGYQLTGRVSVGGKSYRAFTSSVLLDVAGNLYSVGVLFVCIPEPKSLELIRNASHADFESFTFCKACDSGLRYGAWEHVWTLPHLDDDDSDKLITQWEQNKRTLKRAGEIQNGSRFECACCSNHSYRGALYKGRQKLVG